MNRNNLYLSTVDPNAHLIARSHQLGLELAEFCTAWNLDEQFQETDASVREKMKGIPRFTLHGPFNELFPCAIDRKARQLAAFRFRQAIDTAKGYGIRKVILHSGYNPWLYFSCWFTEQSVPFWQELLPHIPEDMTVCVENVLEEEPQMLAKIIRQVDSPKLRMCLDIGHVHAYSKESVPQWMEACADVIDHFHVHNNDSTWDTHSPLLEGTIDMAAFFSAAQTLSPNATMTLELPDAASSVQWLENQGLLEV